MLRLRLYSRSRDSNLVHVKEALSWPKCSHLMNELLLFSNPTGRTVVCTGQDPDHHFSIAGRKFAHNERSTEVSARAHEKIVPTAVNYLFQAIAS
jgi:hypothetical protein